MMSEINKVVSTITGSLGGVLTGASFGTGSELLAVLGIGLMIWGIIFYDREMSE